MQCATSGMTGVPDDVPPVAAISVPGIDQRGYRAYPVVDHIADKIAAILERHGDGRPSTRFRDLIDLTALVTCVRVRAEEQRVAVTSEIKRRGLDVPERFEVPDRELWTSGFARAVRRAIAPPVSTLDEALAIVCPFVDRVLDGTATGEWEPETQEWGRA
jgi:Nucleotidyl transferase AbiEii toxin, Type IV TA system